MREHRGGSSDFIRQLEGYGLTTAHIFYHMPDHPMILQSYLWQDYDLASQFPELKKFLNFWESKLDGRLHGVQVAHSGLVRSAEIKIASGMLHLH